jgi:hypothetical protein
VPMRSHVDPCTFIVYIHIAGEQLAKDLVEGLRDFKPEQGKSPQPLLDRLPPRTHQVHFHEAYHYWQGLRLPFLYRYAFISFRNTFMAFKTLAQQTRDFKDWACILPEFERLGLEERVAWAKPAQIFWGGHEAKLPPEADDEIKLSPLGLLECATSIAEYHVSTSGDKTDPVLLARWAKRNPSYLEPYEFAARFLGDRRFALRSILPLINAKFHTTEPVRTFVELLGRVWGTFARGGDFAREFLAYREPCRWPELLQVWLDELPYEAKQDSDAKILGSPYHRITLENWVKGALISDQDPGGFLIHPFLGLKARQWIERQRANPEMGLLMDQPAWVRNETFWECRSEFSPSLSMFRFHLGDGQDRVLFVAGASDGRGFMSLPLNSLAEWRGFIADTLTVYGAVRRASGAHFDAHQRTCHHTLCPHYQANFCNTYPVIPADLTQCGFPARMQRMMELIGGSYICPHRTSTPATIRKACCS